jgi:outer membrane biosynthesis protein TonB
MYRACLKFEIQFCNVFKLTTSEIGTMEDSKLRKMILAKLQTMENISLKTLRAELEQELGVSLLEKKDFIKDIVSKHVDEEEEPKPEPAKAKPAPSKAKKEEEPKAKRPVPTQTPPKKQKRDEEEEEEEDEDDAPPKKKQKVVQNTPEGDEYINVSYLIQPLT